MSKENAQANVRCEEFRMSSYEIFEDRMLAHEAISKALEERLGEDYTPEEYVKFCQENCIEVPIMPPAYGWSI